MAIFGFARRENPMEKALAKAIQRMLNARVLDQIQTDSQHTYPR
ncbi:MAG TPA: hypothetical protein VF345_11060 [Chthoniobacterales bacterium]